MEHKASSFVHVLMRYEMIVKFICSNQYFVARECEIFFFADAIYRLGCDLRTLSDQIIRNVFRTFRPLSGFGRFSVSNVSGSCTSYLMKKKRRQKLSAETKFCRFLVSPKTEQKFTEIEF